MLRWVEAELGVRVLGAAALEGGTSSAVHLLTIQAPAGAIGQVVLRRYVLDWIAEEPWAPGNEALVLQHLERAKAVPAPRLLAADLAGVATGAPALVMSALPGRVDWEPNDRKAWLMRLAETLPAIHAVPLHDGLRSWAPYEPTGDLVPPPWTRFRGAWEKALALYDGAPPLSERAFVHRDFHPGNVLWVSGGITGIVDWVPSCAGPPEEDVAHCRVNLALHHGVATADVFLRNWLAVAGRSEFHPYWDLVDVLSMVSEEPDAAMDDFVAAAAGRL